jgi:hypothetical protein
MNKAINVRHLFYRIYSITMSILMTNGKLNQTNLRPIRKVKAEKMSHTMTMRLFCWNENVKNPSLTTNNHLFVGGQCVRCTWWVLERWWTSLYFLTPQIRPINQIQFPAIWIGGFLKKTNCRSDSFEGYCTLGNGKRKIIFRERTFLPNAQYAQMLKLTHNIMASRY